MIKSDFILAARNRGLEKNAEVRLLAIRIQCVI